MNNENKKNILIKKQISGVVLFLDIALFVLTAFDMVSAVRYFILGFFGLMIFPLYFMTALFCIAILIGKKFVYTPKYLVYLFLCFFFFMCVVHIIFTFDFPSDLKYVDYLMACFNAVYTPGGMIIGVFTFPLVSLLHNVAGMVFYGIAFFVSLYFVLNYVDCVKKNKELRDRTLQLKRKSLENNRHLNLEDSLSIFENKISTVEEAEDKNLEEIQEEKLQEIKEDNIFIKDDEITLAKKRLGLIKEENFEKEEKDENKNKILFENTVYKEENVIWKNRAKENQDERPQKFVDNGVSLKRTNPLYEKNKEYLKTLYQINTDSSNSIINAENYEDYKEKMREFEKRNNLPFKRDLNVNQTLQSELNQNNDELIITRDRVNDKSTENYQFGIEPNKKIANINGGFDNFEYNVSRTYSNLKDEKIGAIDSLDNFIKPIINEVEDTNITQENKNFNIEEQKNKDVSQTFIEKQGNSFTNSNDILNSIGNTIPLKEQPSNVYNLPKNFKNSDYKQLEIMGTQKDSANSEPKYSYDSKYVKPPIDLLEDYINEEDLTTDHEKNIEILERVLDEFKIPAKVEAVRRGAAVTRYELHMPVGIPVRKIHQHASDIALALASPGEIRIETPIKGKSAVGVEVPNAKIDKVGFKDLISSNEFQNAKKPLTFALGKDIDGNIYCCDMASMPHLLVAGSTGSGKSVCLNTLILSLIYRTSPEDLRLLLVDPKRVEFAIFNGLPHLLMPKAITEPKKALNAFDWLINEMERRFTLFQECYVKNLAEYNSQPEVLSKKFPKLPYLLLIVDELADLVVTTNKKELEEKIIRLTQKARAAGIHVILATQRPSVDIITGSIKINLPSRIAFAVTSFVDSKTILDQGGAEKLLGKGDMLYSPQSSEPIRVQGAFVDTPEVRRVVDFVKNNNPSSYDENLEKIINGENGPVGGASVGASGGEEFDSLMSDALKLIIENGQASISMLQRRFSIGFSRAARIIDQMEVAKFISSSDGSKPRSVYITMEDYEKMFGG